MTRKEELQALMELLKAEFRKMAAEYVRIHPELTLAEIGVVLGLDPADVSRYATEHGVKRPRGAGSPAAKKEQQ
jgi:hypothetical protein